MIQDLLGLARRSSSTLGHHCRSNAAALTIDSSPKISPCSPSQDSRPRAYEALVSLLRTDKPLLQLAALAALRNLIDDWGFYEDGFAPYIGATLECALNLLP